MACSKVVQRIECGGLKACGRFVQYCEFYSMYMAAAARWRRTCRKLFMATQ